MDLGGVEVEVRITLSYFIEPNPGRSGWKDRHLYPSARLRFPQWPEAGIALDGLTMKTAYGSRTPFEQMS